MKFYEENGKYYSSLCNTSIDNVEGFDPEILESDRGWVLHHRLELEDKFGNPRDEEVSAWVLMRLGLYYNRPASELLWVRKGEHATMHNKLRKREAWNKGKTNIYDDETRKNISDTLKEYYKNNPKTVSEETKKKMSESNKGKPHPWNKEYGWYNNGKIEMKCKQNEVPLGFTKGRLTKEMRNNGNK